MKKIYFQLMFYVIFLSGFSFNVFADVGYEDSFYDDKYVTYDGESGRPFLHYLSGLSEMDMHFVTVGKKIERRYKKLNYLESKETLSLREKRKLGALKNKELVVLIHGWPQSWYEWRKVIPSLSRKAHVVAIDLRGACDSSKPEGGYSKVRMAQDVYELVKKLKYNKVKLVGHDIGMMVAYSYAAQFEEEVSKLVLLDVPLPGTQAWNFLKSDPRSWHFDFHLQKDIPELLVTGREREYISTFFQGLDISSGAFTESDIDEYERCYTNPGALTAGFNYYRAFPQDEKDSEVLSKNRLDVPVLALGGEITTGPFIVDMVKEVANNVIGGSIPGTGHWIPEENPDYLIDQLYDFFEF